MLVAVAVIALLATLSVVAARGVMDGTKKVKALSNMRALAKAMILYATDNNSLLPPEGSERPSWAVAASAGQAGAWFNALPALVGRPTVASFDARRADFYTEQNLLFVPAAKYPADRLAAPLFAVSMCSKLRTAGTPDWTVRLSSIQRPSRTVIFQESGVPGEKQLPGQSAYNGQTKSFASRTAVRYRGKALMVFADGHVEEVAARDAVAPTGRAYFPQSLGRVFWTMDPNEDANK